MSKAERIYLGYQSVRIFYFHNITLKYFT
ncbi:unnamed protein product [Plutella xylostella]|uniref:(diamondback moth) hypothetical protein n=1 Tax=Plutella xylostella TaxID=51655 RepID=A0A8S4GBE5_PLUXY|nr:unnamed protein product [Plutella xylostella]